MIFTKYLFGNTPSLAFEPGGLLEEFDSAADVFPLGPVIRAAHAAGVDFEFDEELVLGRLASGQLAIVGLTVDGHPFWRQE